MKRSLVIALIGSLLLNVVLLIRRNPAEPTPRPPLVRTAPALAPAPPSHSLPAPMEVPEPMVPPPARPEEPPAPVRVRVEGLVPRSFVDRSSDPTVTLRVSPPSAAPGDPITVSWTIQSGAASARDWIGLFLEGKDISAYSTYQMVSPRANTMTFKAPAKAGSYEFRYMLDDDRTNVAGVPLLVIGEAPPPPQVTLQTGVVNVRRGGEIPVSVALLGGRNSPQDWIGVFEEGSDNRSFLTWSYVKKVGTTTLRAPDQPGVYEIRYLLDDGFESITTSSRIVVTE